MKLSVPGRVTATATVSRRLLLTGGSIAGAAPLRDSRAAAAAPDISVANVKAHLPSCSPSPPPTAATARTAGPATRPRSTM